MLLEDDQLPLSYFHNVFAGDPLRDTNWALTISASSFKNKL